MISIGGKKIKKSRELGLERYMASPCGGQVYEREEEENGRCLSKGQGRGAHTSRSGVKTVGGEIEDEFLDLETFCRMIDSPPGQR